MHAGHRCHPSAPLGYNRVLTRAVLAWRSATLLLLISREKICPMMVVITPLATMTVFMFVTHTVYPLECQITPPRGRYFCIIPRALHKGSLSLAPESNYRSHDPPIIPYACCILIFHSASCRNAFAQRRLYIHHIAV